MADPAVSSGLQKRISKNVPAARMLDAAAVTRLSTAHRTDAAALAASPTQRRISDDRPNAVRAWLRSLPINPAQDAQVVWLFDGAGATMRAGELIDFYDSLWMPSADDVYARAVDGSWSLFLDHEEVICFLPG